MSHSHRVGGYCVNMNFVRTCGTQKKKLINDVCDVFKPHLYFFKDIRRLAQLLIGSVG